ncbi:DUF192 domain-containing protein [Desulfuribacillus alkaliarsenatis]|uniref:DUF192 domain-containing protein n=1 Tax=Desulfuribacillus alkaliarsenatis TaxID=766136 RepID=A0A1E5G056_9FIRM|nr:DUF192 domain-containing protein [Desulfuribacillus alkaliarsenatis]OEF96202.1 hypothetical protein BHF68_08520 [Desulfuribacillus alkaliarsenatis]
MALVNQTTGVTIADDVQMATSFWSRLKGLMFTARLQEGNALYLSPCRSIHTFFMRYPIDVVYLDEKQQVIAVQHELKPNTIGSIHKHTRDIIELPVGVINKKKVDIGQILKLQTKK